MKMVNDLPLKHDRQSLNSGSEKIMPPFLSEPDIYCIILKVISLSVLKKRDH